MQNEIVRLTKLWHELVGLDYHKDRDCIWYISTVYSYGKEPEFRVEHAGYIFERIDEVANSYEEAEKLLIETIKRAFYREERWADRVLGNPEEYFEDSFERAKKIKEIIGKI